MHVAAVTPDFLSVVIPCYNEEKNIPSVYEKLFHIVTANENTEFILVNNGSTDNSAQVIHNLVIKKPHPRIKMETVTVNTGYGHGILMGCKAACGEYMAWTHADLQTDPEDVLRGYALLQEQAVPEKTFIKGKRIHRSFPDAFFTTGMSLLSSFFLRTWLSDINAQPKLFHRSLISPADKPPHDFSLDLYFYFMAKKRNYAVRTFPVEYKKRFSGTAKGGGSIRTKIPLIIRTVKAVISLRKQYPVGQIPGAADTGAAQRTVIVTQ